MAEEDQNAKHQRESRHQARGVGGMRNGTIETNGHQGLVGTAALVPHERISWMEHSLFSARAGENKPIVAAAARTIFGNNGERWRPPCTETCLNAKKGTF
jgi:hypothetical protein